MTDNLEGEREIMMYLRHEAGHAFNYAYVLYTTPRWRELFGPFFRRYRDDYRPVPFSRHYVRHIEGWYAQKHPDEDFAETFAVWLTPRVGLAKEVRAAGRRSPSFSYVDRVARRAARQRRRTAGRRHRHHRRRDEGDGARVLRPLVAGDAAPRSTKRSVPT